MRGNILVIDDERFVFEDLEYGIGQAHNIFYAETLPQATGLLKKNTMDLAMVDLNIKVKGKNRFSGLDHIKTLRDRFPTLTIVVLSGYSDEDKIVQATKNGADYYLIKGNFDVDSTEFRDQVGKWIKRKKKLDKNREMERVHSWGIGEFPTHITQECLEVLQSKKSFIFVAESGLGRDTFMHNNYIKSYAFKKETKPDNVDLELVGAHNLADYLSLKHGTTSENFLKKRTSKVTYIRNLPTVPLSIQTTFLQVILQQKFSGKADSLKQQFIFFLDEDVAELIESKEILPEFASALPIIRLAPLRERKAELEDFVDRWRKVHAYEQLDFDRQTITVLRRYGFPGNFTELFHLLKKTVSNHKSKYRQGWEQEFVHPESLPAIVHQAPSDLHEEMQLEVARIHLRYIEEALKKYAGERSQK
ncbi:MAG: response regulator, partial [Bacteroidota bacterium]